jgi:hypothetical protein
MVFRTAQVVVVEGILPVEDIEDNQVEGSTTVAAPGKLV